ncbi:sortase domain-containing protein [Streptomyces luteolus]|uniref:Sortase n=1 Tax=Streptomyces luteolus TaxID=3043615 RepID=A0ABT6SPY7_9ACTN|nr:sortase [Streptomyces sp. B-S-A12]MDI3417158.1 sortase [Streptomyces sp. B-S-A12]
MSTPVASRRARYAAASALVLAVGGGLAACGTASGSPAPDLTVRSTATAQAANAAQPLERSVPTGLRIPAIGVDAKSMLDLAVDPKTRELGVPPVDRANEPGWWADGPAPGEKGVAIVVAHYDTANGPALMKDVGRLKVGDMVEVPREDGSTARFKVYEIKQLNKGKVPDETYTEAKKPAELRILTCGGQIKDGHRTDNVIVSADLVP